MFEVCCTWTLLLRYNFSYLKLLKNLSILLISVEKCAVNELSFWGLIILIFLALLESDLLASYMTQSTHDYETEEANHLDINEEIDEIEIPPPYQDVPPPYPGHQVRLESISSDDPTDETRLLWGLVRGLVS